MSKRRVALLGGTALALVCVTSLPSAAFGQGRTWAGTSLAQIVEAAHWRLGAIRVNASLSLANAGYDTDIYYGYIDNPSPDVTFRASVPIQALLPLGKKAVLEAVDSPQYLFYFEEKKERAWNNVFSSHVHLAFERVYLKVGGGLSNVRQRMSPELDLNIREKTKSLDGTFLWQVGRRVSLAALYGSTQYDYGDSEFGGIRFAETLNRRESFVDLATYLEPSPKIRLFIDGQYGTYVFTKPGVIGRNTRSYGVLGGLEFVPKEGGGAIEPPQGRISLGYMQFDVLEAAAKDGSGFVGVVDVSTGIFKKMAVRAFFSRDFTFSVYSEGTFYLSTSFGGGISRRLSKKTSFSYDILFGRSEYPDNESGSFPPFGNYRFMNHSFVLNIQLARYLNLSLLTTLGIRERGAFDADRRRNFFGLSLTYGIAAGSISTPVAGLTR